MTTSSWKFYFQHVSRYHQESPDIMYLYNSFDYNIHVYIIRYGYCPYFLTFSQPHKKHLGSFYYKSKLVHVQPSSIQASSLYLYLTHNSFDSISLYYIKYKKFCTLHQSCIVIQFIKHKSLTFCLCHFEHYPIQQILSLSQDLF